VNTREPDVSRLREAECVEPSFTSRATVTTPQGDPIPIEIEHGEVGVVQRSDAAEPWIDGDNRAARYRGNARSPRYSG
jgi:hypothetical protein